MILFPWRHERLDVPINAINGNLVFARGRVAAVYRNDTVNYGLLSRSEKHEAHGQLAWWTMRSEADFSIYRVCREYPADAYVDDTVGLIDERYADRERWERLLARQAEHMRSMRSFVPEVYTSVSLSQSSLPWSRSSGRDVRVLRDVDASALDTLTTYLDARRARTLELQWMLRRAAVRGVCEPDVDPNWAPPALSLDGGVWEPGRSDVQSFMPVIVQRPRSLLVEGEDGESLQALLVMGRPQRTADFPGSSELLFAPLESLDFPVDAVAHVRWLSNKKMLSICDDAVKDANDEVDDALARFLDRKTKRRAQEVVDVQDYFASEPYPPGLDTFVCFAVGAPVDQPKLLEERVSRLKQAYRPVRLYRPVGLQRQLFEEHMLRPDGAQMRDYRKDYRRLMIAEQFAAMMPIGVNQGGARRGIYAGHTIHGVKRPVKINPRDAVERGRTGAIFANGALGSGKTVALQLVAYLAEHCGAIVVDIDPKKPEPDHSLDRWPGMEGCVEEVLIASVEEHRGQLDPLIFAPDDLKEELGSGYMMDIIPQTKEEWQTEIIDSVRAVLRESDPCSWRVVDRLLASDDPNAVAAGKALRVWADWGIGKLAFSRGGVAAPDVHRPVTMIKAPVLSLPLAGTTRASYDQSERVSVAVLKLIIAKAMRTLSGVPRNALKVLVIDEVHVFTPTADGRRFLEMVIRMARFMGIVVVLGSQMAGDLGELDQLIGTDFIFRQETSEQAQINLRRLGLDPDDKTLVDMLLGFDKGECLMRGLDKRIVPMRFDPVDPEILVVANTNPDQVIGDLERAYAT